jgi:hypothetical protein
MNQEERQERLGDPSIDRAADRATREIELVDRLKRGLPLSRGDAAIARRLIKGGA